jgi:hypothetical protein
MCGLSRRMMTPTEMRATSAVRKVPAAVKNSRKIDAAPLRLAGEVKRLRRRVHAEVKARPRRLMQQESRVDVLILRFGLAQYGYHRREWRT